MDKFFENNFYVINEKIAVIKNSFDVQDQSGNIIGSIKENMPTSRIILSLFVNKRNLPFQLDVLNAEGKLVASLKRGFTFILSTSKLFDENGNQIATMKQKFKLLKPEFELLDMNNNLFATIKGDWKAWDFHIYDENSNEIGTVSKQWNGLAKELFTSADKYNVSINSSVSDSTKRIAIATVASAIDLILKENK